MFKTLRSFRTKVSLYLSINLIIFFFYTKSKYPKVMNVVESALIEIIVYIKDLKGDSLPHLIHFRS